MTKISRETAFARLTDIRDDHILEGDISALLSARAYGKKQKTPSGFARFMQSGWGTFAACAVVAVGIYVALLGLGKGWFGTPGGNPGTDIGTATEQNPVTETETEPDVAWSSEGLEYVSQNDGTCMVSIRNFTGTALRIPETSPDGDKVTVIMSSRPCGPAALQYCSMPDTVTVIEDSAFRQCTQLRYIEWSAGLREIGNIAFESCAISELILPDGVTEIGSNCFFGCADLKTAVLPAGLSIIPDKTFCLCTSLTSVTFPEGLTEIGKNAFNGCTQLGPIDLPAGLMKVGSYAFSGCDNITEITLHAGVTQVSGWLYEGSFVQVTRFTGTMDEWKAVKMVDLIRTDLKVICSDGIVNDN